MVKKLAQEERTKKILDLQDQRADVMDEKRDITDRAFAARHESRPSQIVSGAKSVVDMYQKSATLSNKAEEIAKRTHDLQDAANQKLRSIDDGIKKLQREKGAFPG